MPYILGLDPSLAKCGFVVLDTSKSMIDVVERGLLKTKEGVLVQRLIRQANQLRVLIKKYNIKFIASEAPYFGGGESEMLYALHQFFHAVYLKESCFVLTIPPQMLKKSALPHMPVTEIHKPNMVEKAKDLLGLHGKRLSNDVADAYHASRLGYKFYKWHFEKVLKDKELDPYELQSFAGQHTYTRGMKKGVTEYNGIIFRENELFFDYKKINELTLKKEQEAKNGQT